MKVTHETLKGAIRQTPKRQNLLSTRQEKTRSARKAGESPIVLEITRAAPWALVTCSQDVRFRGSPTGGGTTHSALLNLYACIVAYVYINYVRG